MSKKSYKVVYQGQVIGTRKSGREYTHAIIALSGGSWGVIGYCGSFYLAVKSPEKRRFEKAGVVCEIVPVQVAG